MIGKYQHEGARRCGAIGDGVTLISPGWSPEQPLTVTALPSFAEGVLVLRVVGEVDLATVGDCGNSYITTYPASTGGWFWTAPGCHSWRRVGSAC